MQMRTIPVIVAALVATGSTALAQLVVTPQTPLGQGFVPNGTQNTPSNSSGNTLQPYQSLPSNRSAPREQRGGSTQSGLNWLYAPAPSGRATPQGPLGGPERPASPLR